MQHLFGGMKVNASSRKALFYDATDRVPRRPSTKRPADKYGSQDSITDQRDLLTQEWTSRPNY